ncbi:disease resistance protein RPM1-like [Tasmannia lanceolata]|uniref:disease resistance protein RPM1-like n=1 Tax=Tasmannia lanceolata TaxID=3420 RepID=UPI004063EB73
MNQKETTMAGSVLRGSMCFLLHKLAEEASLLQGVSGEYVEIKSELESMQSFLNDAEKKEHLNEGARNWMIEVRDVIYEVEDIIDELKHHMENQQGGLLHFFRTIFVRHQLATQLQDIKKKVHNISERRNRYGLEKIEEGSASNDDSVRWHRYAASSFFLKEDDIVGMEKNKDLLLRWLTREEAPLMLCAVVGMGGLGKTTLVTQAYNSQAVKKHFHCYAWISVSQAYQIEELLKSLIKELFKVNKEAAPKEIDKMDYRQLVESTISYLQGKRYVVVLDDVWSVDVWSS